MLQVYLIMTDNFEDNGKYLFALNTDLLKQTKQRWNMRSEKKKKK